MQRFFIILVVIFSLLSGGEAGARTKTTRPKPKAEKAAKTDFSANLSAVDTCLDSLIVSGYDKTAGASKESFFITNHTPDTIQGICVEIKYFTLDRGMLHSRSENLATLLPPGETRRLDIPSWDRQNVFYYFKNTASGKAKGKTPYIVKMRIAKAWSSANHSQSDNTLTIKK